ncbi:MAG: hypothetical protein N3A61_08245 [Ignavibacteria bacterium]|nr:hypothetical protein [Ignavibacteria bacterium]
MKRVYFYFIILLAFTTNFFCGEKKIEPLNVAIKERFKFLPKNPQMLIYLNLGEIKKTDFWKNQNAEDVVSSRSERLKEFEEKTGLRIEKDINELILALEWNEKITLILNGNFNRIQLRGFLDEDSSVTSKKDLEIHFIDNNTVIATNDIERLEQIKLNRISNSLLDNKIFMKGIEKIRFKNQFWLATNQGMTALSLFEKKINLNGNTKIKELINSINFVNLSAELSSDVTVNSLWFCINEEKADLLRSVINGTLALLKLASPNDKLIEELAKADIESESNIVEIKINLSNNLIDTLRNTIELKQKLLGSE